MLQNNFMNRTNLGMLHQNLLLSKKLSSSVTCLDFSKTKTQGQRKLKKSSGIPLAPIRRKDSSKTKMNYAIDTQSAYPITL